MGLAVTAAQATRVTDNMIRVAAATLGDASTALANPDQPLLPAWNDVPDVAVRIARAVAAQAVADRVAPKRGNEELTQRISEVRCPPPHYPASFLAHYPHDLSWPPSASSEKGADMSTMIEDRS
jgi:malate dehydrogenase (oxaloacetate-decarboxylating)